LPGAAPGRDEVAAFLDDLASVECARGRHAAQALSNELGKLLWQHAGIVRDGKEFAAGLEALAALREQAADLDIEGAPERGVEFAYNLRFMLPVAEAVLRGALLREESRGAHYRKDFPEEQDAWRKTILYRRVADGALQLETAAVGEVSADVERALQEEHGLAYHHLE
jgi:succinate dehydrogenase / fumarate reductase flavoprotein subunit